MAALANNTYPSVMTSRHTPPAIGPRLQHLRKERGLTLDELSAASSVSRSMLSQIERGQANPTLATVWHLSQALGVELSEFVGGQRVERRGRIEVTAASFVPEIRTEDGQCVMRILSPASEVGRTELYHLTIAPGGELVSDAHARGSSEHLSVLVGELTVESADTVASVATGSIARYPVDVPHAIRNNSRLPAQALLVVIS
jgi:XRE family transcriptional regulator, regulator of sulfur utilization